MSATLLDALGGPHRFTPRRVAFATDRTPTHWVPGDPHTTHVVNVLHLLLPAGERWFCDIYRQALPAVGDEELRRDVKAFIGQEATHARAHSLVLDHLLAQRIDPRPFTRVVELGFGLARVPTPPDWLPRRLRQALARHMLVNWLAVIAAIEHFTSALGWWILIGRGLDEAGADPEMLALLRWHGAEEVEHRSVAFDTYRALGGGYLRRCVAMVVVVAGLFGLWAAGTGFLLRQDRTSPRRRASPPAFVRAGRLGRLPRTGAILAAVPRYMAPRYHPSHEGRTEVAIAYLADAPGTATR